MKTYLAIDEFCQLVHLKREVVDGMIERGALNTKVDNYVYITGIHHQLLRPYQYLISD